MVSFAAQTKGAAASKATQGPRTRQEALQLRKSSDLRGWFCKIRRGRPPKARIDNGDDEKKINSNSKRKSPPAPLSDASNLPNKAPKVALVQERTNWRLEENFPIL
jgi:hypothetical protein